MPETKNQIAWEKISQKLNFIEKIVSDGSFDITARDIKEISGREPRLMAKFDHSVNRPKIFLDEGIGILPVTQSSYKLLKFNSFCPVFYEGPMETVAPVSLRHFQTINLQEIHSEDSALIVADISNLLGRFVADEIRLTCKGKFRTAEFDFLVAAPRCPQTIHVRRALAELDAGFEGDKVYLVEAKMGKVSDFNIRQLYYPYRFWSAKIKKEIVPIFFAYSDGVFSFWQYAFSEPSHFNSISLVRQAHYTLDPAGKIYWEQLKIQKLPSDEKGVPFPQADDFEKVINVVELVGAEFVSKEEFADYFDFDLRQADYYANAARYLGLVEKNRTGVSLTDFGRRILNVPRSDRHRFLVEAVLSRKVFFDAFCCLRDGRPLGLPQVVELMKRHHVMKGASESMFKRRASTVLSWVKWVENVLDGH